MMETGWVAGLCFSFLLLPGPQPRKSNAQARKAAAHSTRTAQAKHSRSPARRRRPSRKKRSTRGRRAADPARAGIAPERASAIEKALVAAGYLAAASGHWDRAAEAAMKQYQNDHHWQTRFVPDSRALIALGLGPARDSPVETSAPVPVPTEAAEHLTATSNLDEGRPASDPGAAVK